MTITQEIIKECHRQEESCLYTSTTFYYWLRSVRRWNLFFVVTPIILGSIASWNILTEAPTGGWQSPVIAIAALLAGLFPAVYKALKLDVHVEEISGRATIFKNLQDRFRQLANFADHRAPDQLETIFRELTERLEDARAGSFTPPERFFKKAQKKIKSGDYDFEADISSQE